MLQFSLNGDIAYLERKPFADEPVLTLITSKDVEQNIQIPGIEHLLVHTPLARDVRVCKTEPGRNYISGTILTPRRTKEQQEIAFGYLFADFWKCSFQRIYIIYKNLKQPLIIWKSRFYLVLLKNLTYK